MAGELWCHSYTVFYGYKFNFAYTDTAYSIFSDS